MRIICRRMSSHSGAQAASATAAADCSDFCLAIGGREFKQKPCVAHLRYGLRSAAARRRLEGGAKAPHSEGYASRSVRLRIKTKATVANNAPFTASASEIDHRCAT